MERPTRFCPLPVLAALLVVACGDETTIPTQPSVLHKPAHAGGNGKGNQGDPLIVTFPSNVSNVYTSGPLAVEGQNTADGIDINKQPATLTFHAPTGCNDPLFAQLDGKDLEVADGFGIVMDKTAGENGSFSINDRVRVFMEGSGFSVSGDDDHVYQIRLHSINNEGAGPGQFNPTTDVDLNETPLPGGGLSTEVSVKDQNVRISKYLPTGKKGKNALELVERDTCVGGAVYSFRVEPAS